MKPHKLQVLEIKKLKQLNKLLRVKTPLSDYGIGEIIENWTAIFGFGLRVEIDLRIVNGPAGPIALAVLIVRGAEIESQSFGKKMPSEIAFYFDEPLIVLIRQPIKPVARQAKNTRVMPVHDIFWATNDDYP